MGDRKVLNRYIPPDFDPSKLPKMKMEKDRKMNIRMMMPFTMRCKTCGEFLYVGTKFNSQMEAAKGEDYLGVRIWRFFFTCWYCRADITFKTDPKNGDYDIESGATRRQELWLQERDAANRLAIQQETMGEQDVMTKLENKTIDTRAEVDTIEALEELRALNQQSNKLEDDALWKMVEDKHKVHLSDKDIDEAKKAFEVKELKTVKLGDDIPQPNIVKEITPKVIAVPPSKPKKKIINGPKLLVRKKRKAEETEIKDPIPSKFKKLEKKPQVQAFSGFGGDSDSDSDTSSSDSSDE
eukprot:TRINITY_DN779956_c0_g1_i1.p1 TRINITY_DN779956_c0_g1~~TRINITY_DN779956_c0_g1_i1.p1  ORF type:complete len:296 (-),score=97.47 TRINITY_DN779956_c0_g1_i1:168-1055(-)